MTPKEFFGKNTKERVTEVAIEAGTNFDNFKQIALWGGACSGKLAVKLSISSGQEMTTDEILAPELFSKPAA